MAAATKGVLDTSTVILLGRIEDPATLPDEAVISAITLAEFSVSGRSGLALRRLGGPGRSLFAYVRVTSPDPQFVAVRRLAHLT